MEYKNTNTGVTISSTCVISGGDWVLVKKKEENTSEVKAQVESEEEVESAESGVESEQKVENLESDVEPETGDAAFDSITVPQIKQELDAFGIEYNKRATKQELYDLMMQGK